MAGLFGWLPRARWKKWLVLAGIGIALLFSGIVTLVFTVVVLWQSPKVQSRVMLQALGHQVHQPAALPPKPRLSADEKRILLSNTEQLRKPAELFQPTNVWDVHMAFTSNQWAELGPTQVAPIFHFLKPDGSVILLNTNASRNGLAGVFGLDFPWSQANLRFGNTGFTNVAARFKGNGTFVNSQRSYKRPFKVDLSKHGKTASLAGVSVLNFHNLTADGSCLSDTLAYEFFRHAGVPAPRTAFARFTLSIEGRFQNNLLGLYVLIENPDSIWATEQFGHTGVALFKPVTYELFKDLGEDWAAYERIYDPKTKVRPRQSRRLIALAKLVTRASDEEFGKMAGEYVDLDEFARFLACQVILSNYDGFLSNGQNFLMYLDSETDRLGFIPWDLDQCWGDFGYVGSKEQRERASIWHPWVGENRFLERMFKVDAFRNVYKAQLERVRNALFRPELLGTRLDELAKVVRPFIAEESSGRLARFDAQVRNPADKGLGESDGSRGFSLKHFFEARARSVTDQLEGRSDGLRVSRRGGR